MFLSLFVLFAISTRAQSSQLVQIGDDSTKQYASLSEAITKAEESDVIKLLGDITVDATVAIDKSLTIDGQNHKLTSNLTTASILKVTAGNFTMKDLSVYAAQKIQNGSGGTNADILLNTSGKVEITGCTFDGIADAYYNILEYGQSIKVADGTNLSGNTFKGASARHNCINMFDFVENATVTINNNKFEGIKTNTTNPVRISNYNSVAATVKMDNNDYSYNITDADQTYAGFVLVQNVKDKGTAENMTLSFENLKVNGNVVTKNNTGTANQVVYVYTNATGKVTYDGVKIEGIQMPVAMIGTTYYDSLDDAILAANSSDVVSLISDINTKAQIEIPAGKEITLDLKGKKIAYSGSEILKSGVLLVHNGAGLTVKGQEEGSEITGGNNAYAAIALTNAGDNDQNPAKLTVESGSFSGDYYAIVGNGGRHNTEINIKGGVFTGTHENDNLAIYHPQDGKLTISGGEFTGNNTAIEIRAGEVNISGGKFKATASPTSVEANDNGTTTYGAAIGIAQHNTQKGINVTITNGVFEGYTGLTIYNPQNNMTDNVKVDFQGGTINGSNYAIVAEHGTLNISGGTINAVGDAIRARGNIVNITGGTITSDTDGGVGAFGCNLTISDNAIINSKEGAVWTGKNCGAVINIKGGKLSATNNNVIAGNGSEREGEPNIINISGGEFTGSMQADGYVACGIYAPWKDEITVSGGKFTITNGAGIVARAGVVNITGGEFICSGTTTGRVGDSRVVVTCSPIVFDSEAAYNAMTDASMITVTGGTFSSAEGVPVAKAILAEGETNRRVVLLGGTYSSEPGASYLGAGTKATASEGKYTVSYSTDDAKGVTTVVDEENIEVSNGNTELTGEQKTQAVDAIKAVVNNAAVTSSETNANDAVSTTATTDENKTIVDLLKDAVTDSDVANNIESTNISTSISVTVKSAEVETSGSGVAVTKMVFEIKPVATVVVDGNPVASVVVPNKLITQKIKFRLPVDKNTNKECVEILHKADGASETESLGFFAILEDESGNKYVELERDNFSIYKVVLSDVVSMTVYYVENGSATTTSVAMDKTTWNNFLANNSNAIAIVGSENNTFASGDGIKNVVVEYDNGGTKSYVCPNFVLTDKKDFYSPFGFTAKAGSYNRQPNAATSGLEGVKYNSVCLPFALDGSQLSTTAKILTFSSWDGANTVNFNYATDNKINAGTPCLVLDESATTWNEITFNETPIVASPNNDGNMKGTYSLTSQYGKQGNATTEYYSVNVENKFQMLSNTLSPFRSCLYLHSDSSFGTANENSLLYIVIGGGDNNDGTTGIGRIEGEEDGCDGEVYNIQGQKVGSNLKSLPRGIYIKNGKKVLVK